MPERPLQLGSGVSRSRDRCGEFLREGGEFGRGEAGAGCAGEFIKSTTYDPALGGYPPATSSSAGTTRDNTLDTNTVFDNVKENPLTTDTFIDLHSSEELEGITGALGGGGDFDGVE
jgi:hypothetical protein